MKKIIFIIASLFAALSVNAQQLQLLPNDPAVRKGVLENGMTYYIRQNDKPAQRAEFYLATNIGALQEAPDQDGLAHFLEHMCFNGTKNFPGKGILNYLQSIGASFGGNVNASTGVEQTIYMLTNIPLVNESVVDSCILIMHDYSHFVTCDPKEIDAERGVILEEKRSRNDASWRMREAAGKYIYGDNKYAHTSIIGTEENLKTFKPESLTTFYHTWYRPDNQALIVVGDVDVDAVEAKIKSIFSDIPAPGPDARQKDVIACPENKEPVIGIVTDPEASGTGMTLLWRSPARPEIMNGTAQGLLIDIIEDIVYSGMSERFTDIAARPNAPFISALFANTKLCESIEALYGSVSCADGQAIDAFKAYMTEVQRLKRYGLTDGEVERAKADILNSYENAAKKADTRKNPQFVQPLIQNFFNSKEYMEPQAKLELVKMMMPQINAQVVNMIMAQAITDENFVVVYQAPEKAGLVHPTEADFQKAIAEVAASEIAAPAGEEIASSFLDADKLKAGKVKKTQAGVNGSTIWTLKNGVKVVLLPTEYEKDKISINMFQQGGKSLIETVDLPSFEDNVWSLYQANTGVGQFSSSQVSKMLSGKTVAVGPYIGADYHGVSASTNPKDIETALQLLHMYYTDPRFDEDEYAQGIRQLEAVLPNLSSQPNFILQKALYTDLYNNDRKFFISDEILAKANLQTLERVYRQLFKDAAGAVVVVVGDFDMDTIKPLVEKYIGSLPKGKKATKWIDRHDSFRSDSVLDDFKAPMQTPKVTVAQIYTMDTPYSIEKAVSYSALNYILQMVYTDTLREDEGGTYGASTNASLQRFVNKATLQVVFETNPEQADALRALAVKGLKELAENGPSDEYFDRTVKYYKKLIPERRITNSYWMSALEVNAKHGENYDAEYEAAVNALTPEKVKAVAAEIVAAANLVEIVMRPEL